MKKTPLYNLHQKYGAKFVQFAGYDMPIQYETGIVKEHITTRNTSGIFDVSHMGQLFLKGGDELTNDLQKIFPIDLAKISINQSKYSFLMKENGGIYDDLIITKLKDGYMYKHVNWRLMHISTNKLLKKQMCSTLLWRRTPRIPIKWTPWLIDHLPMVLSPGINTMGARAKLCRGRALQID